MCSDSLKKQNKLSSIIEENRPDRKSLEVTAHNDGQEIGEKVNATTLHFLPLFFRSYFLTGPFSYLSL